jgi:hypothetical protein
METQEKLSDEVSPCVKICRTSSFFLSVSELISASTGSACKQCCGSLVKKQCFVDRKKRFEADLNPDPNPALNLGQEKGLQKAFF